MKILFINPPDENLLAANLPSFVEEERGTYPPLALLYIAAYLRETRPDLQVTVLDAVLEKLSYQEISKFIDNEQPDIVATQALTFTLIDGLKTVKIAKEVNPKIITVLGGRHCDLYPEETIQQKDVDYVIQGEGELTFLALVENLGKPDQMKKIPGLTFYYDNEIINSPPRLIKDINQLPFPARDLTNFKKYRFLLSKGSIFTTLITARGCPFVCTFCDEGRMKFRANTASRIVDEIVECQEKYDIHTFFIFDSTFTVQRKRAVEFCEELIRRKVDIKFDIRTRVDLMNENILQKLKAAGCIRIQYGIESGNNQILKTISKTITVEKAAQTVEQTKSYGFEILCDFMIGLPGEHRPEIEETIQLALSLPIDYAQFSITTPYPNTDLYHDGIRQGLFDDYWKTFSLHPTSDFVAPYWCENFSREELDDILASAYSRFYKRPNYVRKQLLKIRSPGELIRKMKGGMKLLAQT